MRNLRQECEAFYEKHIGLETTVCSMLIDFNELMKHILCWEFNIGEQAAERFISDVGKGGEWKHFKLSDLINGDEITSYEPDKYKLEQEVIRFKKRLANETLRCSQNKWLWSDIIRLNEYCGNLISASSSFSKYD